MINYYTLRFNKKYIGLEGELDQVDPQVLMPDRKAAKRLRDSIGCTLAGVVKFELKEVKEEIQKPRKWGVYVISEKPSIGAAKHFKIGYSMDPIKRVKQLQTAHPIRLGLEGWFDFNTEDDARRYEKELHKTFDSIRARGEWFCWTEAMENFIKQAHHHSKIFTRFLS